MEEKLKEMSVHLCSDVVHDVKNMISGIRTADQTIDLEGHSVSIMSTLWPFVKTNPSIRAMLSDDILFPQDRMDIR